MYPQKARRALAAAAVAVIAAAGCKKKPIAEDPEEQGKLSRIAARLEEGLGGKPLPGVSEPEKLIDRLAKWDDFRGCTVRAFVAKKREADRLKMAGAELPGRHGTIGEAAVAECAVQAAVVRKDPRMCERLAFDFAGPNGEVPLSAVRCWDTRARALGLPDECPVVWLPDDLPGRNPECLAAARRDASLCVFAGDPIRCRAIVTGDAAGCSSPSAAPDCALAVSYWSGLIPAGTSPPLFDLQPRPGEKLVEAAVTVRWPKREQPTIRIEGPQTSAGISWPAGKAPAPWVEDTTPFWGAKIPPEAVQLTWKAGAPAVKIAFVPAGMTSGVRPVQPPGATMPATVILVWPDPRAFRRCLPGPGTSGQVQYDGGGRAGGFVTGKLDARGLACSDGTTVDVEAEFKLAVTDVR